MKTIILKQEILLVIATFCHENLCENDMRHFHHQSQAEQLEEACWNGLHEELLTGIVEKPAYGERLYIWNIKQGRFFLQIEFCDYPQITEKYLSIDPYIFLPVMQQN